MSAALRRTSNAGPDVATIAHLLGDKTRVTMINALIGDHAMPASQLATIAGISRATASEHLSHLVQRRLLNVERHGRHAYYRLASSDVATALEALAALAPIPAPSSLRGVRQLDELSEARTCYDHLAGRLGVLLADTLREHGLIRIDRDALSVDVARWDEHAPLGVRCEELPRTGRPLVRPCLDWSEHRYHVAGALPSALTDKLLELRWVIRPRPHERIVRITEEGEQGLRDSLGVDLTTSDFHDEQRAAHGGAR